MRPKVLILTPFRNDVMQVERQIRKKIRNKIQNIIIFQIVTEMRRLLFGGNPTKQKQVQNAQRLKGSILFLKFSVKKSKIGNLDDFEQQERDSLRDDLPDDHKRLFAGNIDDRFRIGLGIAKKTLKLLFLKNEKQSIFYFN